MSYNWGASYYDSFYGNSDKASSWRSGENPYAAQQQHNPVFPSNYGSSSYFSSSSQRYAPPSYETNQFIGRKSGPKRGSSQKSARGKKGNTQAVPKLKNIHLVSVNPDPTGTTKLPENVAKIGVASPKPSVKVARGNNKSNKPKRGRGVQKMPNYNGLAANGHGWDNTGFQRGGGGGFPASRGNRGGRGGGGGRRFYRPPRPTNSKDDIPYSRLPDSSPAINLNVNSENIVAFHGFDSVFTTQHAFPVLIDNRIYTSCDHYYQIRKVIDLTGSETDSMKKSVRDSNGKLLIEEKSDEKEKKAFSAVAKEIIKSEKIEKEKVDEWRLTKGLEAIQKALYAKATQSAHLREALKESGDQILVHAFPRDSIYGTGCGVIQIKKWLDELGKSGVQTLRVPAQFPLNDTTVQNCPVFAQGRNILGVILMQIREKVRKNEIEIVDMTKIYDLLRSENKSDEPMDTSQPKSTKFSFSAAKPTAGTF
uniref:NADAR domain-containing protein n=1 Tax=Caenorhabditis japonica TaxID=281687 RepID=A0A8R1HKH9_CAEJA